VRVNTRPIPASGEPLPVIGCGTYRGFDHPLDSAVGRRLPGVVDAKVWTSGRGAVRQMEGSLRKLRVERLDLMQIHNPLAL
jgi:aryl-alcohol dehydrogenase-like predicted oxidoreductase